MTRFFGLDVHEASTSICVRDRQGRIVEEAVIPTTAAALRKHFPKRRHRAAITFEEGPLAQWMFELLHDRVGRIVVCNPRHHRLIGVNGKSDRIDAARLAELLRLGGLRPVVHLIRPPAIRELVKTYDLLVGDAARVMFRLRAIYRQKGIPAMGMTVYTRSGRRAWLRRVKATAAKARLMSLYQQLDATVRLRDDARVAMITHAAIDHRYPILRSIPYVGEIRAAQLLALVATRSYASHRHLCSYAGLSVVVHTSSDHVVQQGKLRPRPPFTRGLTRSYNPSLKKIFKDIALSASVGRGPFRGIFDAYVERGLSIAVARVALARRIVAVVFALLRDGSHFDPTRLAKNSEPPGDRYKPQQIPLPPKARA